MKYARNMQRMKTGYPSPTINHPPDVLKGKGRPHLFGIVA